MRAVVLYHPMSDHGRIVEEYVRDFKHFKHKEVELVSLETLEGADIARLYDVTIYPAVLVIGPGGVLQKMWQGSMMPLMNEIDSYLPNNQAEFARASLLTA